MKKIIILMVLLLAVDSYALLKCGESTSNCGEIVEFSEGPEIEIEFLEGGGSNSDAKVNLPKGFEVCSAEFQITPTVEEVVITTTTTTLPELVPADIAVVFDTTGSMGGPITSMKTNVNDFADALVAAGIDSMFGLVDYRDTGDAPCGIVSSHDLTDSVDTFKGWVNAMSAGGGGDAPEQAFQGIEEAMGFSYRGGTQKVIILITDAASKTSACSGNSMDDVITSLKDNGFKVYIIDYCASHAYYTQMASETGGKCYPLGSDLGPILEEIAGEIGNGPGPPGPVGPPAIPFSLDIGNDDVVEWRDSITTDVIIYDGNTNPRFREKLTDLLKDCNCPGCLLAGDDCTIDLEITTDQGANITLDSLMVKYCEKTCGEPCGEINCTIYRYSEDFPKVISLCLPEIPGPIRFLERDDHYMQEPVCEKLLELVVRVEGWNLAADGNQKLFKNAFELWYDGLKLAGLDWDPNRQPFKEWYDNLEGLHLGWNPSLIPYVPYEGFTPFSENRIVVGEAWDPSFNQNPVSPHREGRALDMYVEDITDEKIPDEVNIIHFALLNELGSSELVYGDVDVMNESVLAEFSIKAGFDWVFHSCEHIHVCVSTESGATGAEHCHEPRYNFVFDLLGIDHFYTDTPTPYEDGINSISLVLGERRESMGTRGGIRITWEDLPGGSPPPPPMEAIAASAAGSEKGIDEPRKGIATAARAPESVGKKKGRIRRASLQEFWAVAGILESIPFVGKSSLGKGLSSVAVSIAARGTFKSFVKKVIFERIEEMCNGMDEFILLNPDLRHHNVINSVELFIHLLQPFYLLAIAITAIYLIFLSGSVIGRARAKSTLISLVISFAVIIFTIPILGFLLDFSQFAASFLLDLVDTQIGSEVVCGEGLHELEHLYSVYMRYVYENPTVIMMFTSMIYLGTFLVLSLRFFMIILWTLFFPFAVFFYAFHFTRNLGRFMLFQTSWWILIQIVGAMTWISITVAWILLSGNPAFPVSAAVFEIAFALTGMIVMAAMPLFALGIMDWISFLLFSLSALGEPMIGATIGVIDEMGVESMEEEREITPPTPIGPD